MKAYFALLFTTERQTFTYNNCEYAFTIVIYGDRFDMWVLMSFLNYLFRMEYFFVCYVAILVISYFSFLQTGFKQSQPEW